MRWRMDPEVTRYMNTDPKLTMEGQKKWLASIESDRSVEYWLIEVKGRPAGVINLADINWKEGKSSWGYYVAEKDLRSFPLAISLEMNLYDYVFDTLGLQEVHGEVFRINRPILRLHLFCGCHVIEEKKEEVEKNGIFYDVVHIGITREEWHAFRKGKHYEKIQYNIP
jgi:hypothetical protein